MLKKNVLNCRIIYQSTNTVNDARLGPGVALQKWISLFHRNGSLTEMSLCRRTQENDTQESEVYRLVCTQRHGTRIVIVLLEKWKSKEWMGCVIMKE